MKTCFKCARVLSLDEFYEHPQMLDGHLNKCKECTKNDVRVRSLLHPENVRKYDKIRNSSDGRRRAKRKYQAKHRVRNPEKYKARNAVSNAIRDGRLIRPECCSLCGRPGKVEAHHSDYSNPLEVEWLCFACHRSYEHGQIVTSV